VALTAAGTSGRCLAWLASMTKRGTVVLPNGARRHHRQDGRRDRRAPTTHGPTIPPWVKYRSAIIALGLLLPKNRTFNGKST
jgi:hypothetical protein